MKKRYAYFPGCSAKGSCQELDLSTKAVAALFDIDLVELDNPGCTGAREFRAVSERLHLVANGRILALAEAAGGDLVVVCDTCLLNLTDVNERLRGDSRARDEVNTELRKVGLEYGRGPAVRHFLWVLLEDVGEARLREKIVRPLTGLRAAPFYGCHLLRPASVYGENAAARSPLETLCAILGAEPVAYEGATKCCGFHVVLTEERTALRMSGAHLKSAKDGGAHCLVTPCPLCHTVLDVYQPQIEQEVGSSLGVPVLHLAQLVGLAVGLKPKTLGLSRHVVDTRALADVLGT
jgi:succinate dehydrogenase / fumarate reductase, cytochrome b subunit